MVPLRLKAERAGRLFVSWMREWRARTDSLDRLTPFGCRGGLIFILGFSFLSFLLYGYFIAYWRNADMDFMVVYSALALNDGGERAFFDHPAFLSILSVEAWFRFLHHLGLLDSWKLSAIPAASDPAFDVAMTNVIRAGRTVALITAGSLVLAFNALARRIVVDQRIAILGVFAFAISGGVQMHLRILRSEMIAGCFCILALMILIVAARRGTLWRPLLPAFAAGLCVLALENKVQAILLIAALPALILPFGTTESCSVVFWRSKWAWLPTLSAAVAAVFLVVSTWPLISVGLDSGVINTAGLKPVLLGRFGIYQALLLGWIIFCMIAFAAIWRVSPAETLAAIFLLIAGASLALLPLNIQFNIYDVVAVFNPIEKMMMYVDVPEASGSPMGALGLLISGILRVLQRYTFVLHSSPRPAVFLTWLVIPGIIYSWRRGQRQIALCAALLMMAAIGIDAIGVRRGLKIEYFVFTDPLIILAGMILLDGMSEIRFHSWAYPIGAALIVLHVVISQAEPVKLVLKNKGPEGVCEWNQFYLPKLRVPWCPAQG